MSGICHAHCGLKWGGSGQPRLPGRVGVRDDIIGIRTGTKETGGAAVASGREGRLRFKDKVTGFLGAEHTCVSERMRHVRLSPGSLSLGTRCPSVWHALFTWPPSRAARPPAPGSGVPPLCSASPAPLPQRCAWALLLRLEPALCVSVTLVEMERKECH